MAIPPTAFTWTAVLDPRDLRKLQIWLRKPGEEALREGEDIDDYTLSLLPEALLVGFGLRDDGDYAPTNTNDTITVYPFIDPDMQHAPAFDPPGVKVGMELWVKTTSFPPEEFERTLAIGVAQQ